LPRRIEGKPLAAGWANVPRALRHVGAAPQTGPNLHHYGIPRGIPSGGTRNFVDEIQADIVSCLRALPKVNASECKKRAAGPQWCALGVAHSKEWACRSLRHVNR
jgi:hypothetical protein